MCLLTWPLRRRRLCPHSYTGSDSDSLAVRKADLGCQVDGWQQAPYSQLLMYNSGDEQAQRGAAKELALALATAGQLLSSLGV